MVSLFLNKKQQLLYESHIKNNQIKKYILLFKSGYVKLDAQKYGLSTFRTQRLFVYGFVLGGFIMWSMLYPILIIVLSNILYNVCTKSTPNEVNAFATLSITYLVAALVSFATFFVTSKGKNIFAEFTKTNWTTFVLGVVIIGLEIGYILAFRNGWAMSKASVTANIALAVALIFVSMVFYKESITVKQVIGIVLCGGGLVLVNY